MVGVLIIGLVVAGVLSSLPQLRKLVVKSEMAQTASMLANSELENFRTMSFDAIWALRDESAPLSGKPPVEMNGVDYSRTVWIKPYTLNGVSDQAVEITVTLSWELQGQSLSTTSWSVFTKDGLSDKKFSDAN